MHANDINLKNWLNFSHFELETTHRNTARSDSETRETQHSTTTFAHRLQRTRAGSPTPRAGSTRAKAAFLRGFLQTFSCFGCFELRHRNSTTHEMTAHEILRCSSIITILTIPTRAQRRPRHANSRYISRAGGASKLRNQRRISGDSKE